MKSGLTSGPFVHPTAVVDEGVELGAGVKVWHFAHVSAGASIGEGTSLGQGSFVGRGVRVGARVKVQNHVSIYEGVSVEDDVFLGPSCVFTNVSCPRAFDARMDELAPTRIGRGATVGANATIICGHDVGAYAFVGAGAVVTKDVPPHALVVGNPAKRIGWVSRLGRRLPDGEEVACPESGERYRVDRESCEAIAASPESGSAPTSAGALAPAPMPFVDLRALHAPLEDELRAAFDRVLRSGTFVLGGEVAAFEKEAAQFLGVEHAIGVSSGSDALLVSLMALGIGPGDEVVTTPFSFFATVGAILRLGARPVFADIDPETLLIDPAQVEKVLSDRTRAILPVHLFGRCCDVPALRAAAKRRGLAVPIVEDAAQAFGARLGEAQSAGAPSAGALGEVGCFSLFPTKTLGALGDGGLVTTNDATLATAIRRLRVHGAAPRYHHETLGGNFRLDELQAALLRVKLPHLPGWIEARRAAAKIWAEELERAGVLGRGVSLVRADGDGHGAAQLALLLPEGERDRVREALRREGVGTEVYYPEPLHLQPALGEHRGREGDFPRAEEACRRVLCLPLGVGVERGRVREVVGVVG